MDKMCSRIHQLSLAEDDFCDYFAAPPVVLEHKYSHKVFLDNYIHKENDVRNRLKDKSEHATVENVLDPRTRMIIFKMLNRGFFTEIQGCISTGKEANVYFAPLDTGPDRAVKIFKTSILTFKDRDKYISGDYRFRHGYCRRNPRKMVESWAEKEFRNLTRMYREGLSCPEPILLRSHVLVMSFVGNNGIPAPLLKDTDLAIKSYCKFYIDLCKMMQDMCRKCNLIHSDLSEFNILLDNNKLIIIDVSQAVELDHPHAMVFLRKDCVNVTDFFKKRGVDVMTVQQLFNFVTCATTDDVLTYIETVRDNDVDEDSVDEMVFIQSYLPKRLDEVIDPEREIFEIDLEREPSVGANAVVKLLAESLEGDSFDTGVCDFKKVKEMPNCRRPRSESPASKRERKKLVKEARHEKLKTKVQKHVKQKRRQAK